MEGDLFMKKILMLGGAMQQIPIIKKAKEMGFYVITCDYTPDNPGHQYSDKYYNVSTTDMNGVLELAQELEIDGIIAYASDPAAPTAAFVAEKMGLSGNPYKSVDICTQKDLFRTFLKNHGFNTPKAKGFDTYDQALAEITAFKFPVMVKPVDSSGSKGVVKIHNKDELKDAVTEALYYSRKKRFVIEEYIVKKGYQISGDGFSYNGKLVFSSYGNELYSSMGGTRDYVALGEFWPSLLTNEEKIRVDNEIQRLLLALGMKTGAYNIEAIIDENDDVYILELGPRNGGSYIPQLINYATGVDLLEYTIKGALGMDCSGLNMSESRGYYSNYMIMSHSEGKFKGIVFDELFERENLLDVYCTYHVGDVVRPYRNTTDSLGTIIFKANSFEEIERITKNIERYYHVEV